MKKYRIKNLTYSVLRVMVGTTEIRLKPRKYTYSDVINHDLKKLEKEGFIKIRLVK
jgi:hypothetical protein